MPFLVVRTTEEWIGLEARLMEQGVERVRVVRLTEYETLLVENVAVDWRILTDTVVRVSTIPPLTVVDYVPGSFDDR